MECKKIWENSLLYSSIPKLLGLKMTVKHEGCADISYRRETSGAHPKPHGVISRFTAQPEKIGLLTKIFQICMTDTVVNLVERFNSNVLFEFSLNIKLSSAEIRIAK